MHKLKRDGAMMVFGNTTIPSIQKRFSRMESAIAPQKESNKFLLSVATETPIWRDQWQCWEKILIDENSLDLEWVDQGRSALLFNHDPYCLIGKNERVFVQNNILFSESKLKEGDYLEDVKNGFLSNTSIGYEIISAYVEKNDNNEDVVIIDRARILEISLVSIPADFSTKIEGEINQQKSSYSQEEQEEEGRKKAIFSIAKKHNIPDFHRDLAIASGSSISQFSREAVSMNRPTPTAIPMGESYPTPTTRQTHWKSMSLGLSDRDKANYSIARIAAYKAGFDVPKPEFELEVSRALGNKIGREAQGLWIPTGDLDWSPRSRRQQRGLWSGGNGGQLVETNLGEFVSLLRSKLILGQMGATVLTGLTGNLDLPKMSEGVETQWIKESAVIPESDPVFATIEIRPHTLASRVPVTRRLLLQASENYDLEMILRDDLVASIAVEADRAAIAGSGADQEPRGLINNPEVSSIALGTNGGAVGWEHIVDLEALVAGSNADIGSLGYVMSPSVRGVLKRKQKFTGDSGSMWENLPPNADLAGAGYVNGYLAMASTTVPSNLTKGSGSGLSAIVFGDWSQLYLSEFGAIDVMSNPYGRMFPTGGVEIRAMMDLDIQPRRPESFAIIKDVDVS